MFYTLQHQFQLKPATNKAERTERGQMVYSAVCMACHQAEGQGIPMAFPPLAASDYLNAAAFAQPILTHFRDIVHAVFTQVEEKNKWE